jgi:GNAT superfamily N-acetyltransferase
MEISLIPDRLPPDYPADLQRWVHLADGRRVFVRPVVAEDAPAIERALASADSETVYQRFFRAPVRLDARALDRLTRLDYRSRMALAAFTADGEGVAIARYETTEEGVAEVAVVVDVEWRHGGIGNALLEMLEEAAVVRGVTRFTALYLPDNAAIAALLQRRGFAIGLPDEAVAAAEKLLTAAERLSG